jgi:DNA polymerase-3 subunit alpha
LANKADGAWVTVGGIVAECKRIRTKSGSHMMFATLDDIEGQVEMLIFKADQAESASVVTQDAVVIVRGRVDHKERGETKLVVSEAERFEPDQAGISAAAATASRPAGPLTLRINAADFRPTLVEELKSVFEHFQGETEVLLEMQTRDGTRRLRFGPDYRVRTSSGLRAELDVLLGPGVMAA